MINICSLVLLSPQTHLGLRTGLCKISFSATLRVWDLWSQLFIHSLIHSFIWGAITKSRYCSCCEWMNQFIYEIGEVFWTAFILQVGQNITGWWQEFRAIAHIVCQYHQLTIEKVADILRVAHCVIAIGLLKHFKRLCCWFPKFNTLWCLLSVQIWGPY